MKYILISLVSLFVVFVSCSHTTSESTDSAKTDAGIVNGEIELPLPPAEITNSADRADYILYHFWDPMEIKDTLHSHDMNFLEQNFANYISLFAFADSVSIKKSVFKLLSYSEKDPALYQNLMDIADKYLYDPRSPMVNEEYYIPFLEYRIESGSSNERTREVARYFLENILKNRQGTLATDFYFEDLSGQKTSLYSIYPDRDLMLIFYDPDCGNCETILGKLATDAYINKGIEEGKMGILAIYSGSEKEEWKEKARNLPTNWIIGYEPGEIDEEEIYDLRAMPTIYLLNKEKVVVEKNFNP